MIAIDFTLLVRKAMVLKRTYSALSPLVIKPKIAKEFLISSS